MKSKVIERLWRNVNQINHTIRRITFSKKKTTQRFAGFENYSELTQERAQHILRQGLSKSIHFGFIYAKPNLDLEFPQSILAFNVYKPCHVTQVSARKKISNCFFVLVCLDGLPVKCKLARPVSEMESER